MARIAEAAFGVVTRVQLLEAGLTPGRDSAPAGTGALIRVHRGVYRVGHAAASTDASYLAAVYACGPRPRSSEAARLVALSGC